MPSHVYVVASAATVSPASRAAAEVTGLIVAMRLQIVRWLSGRPQESRKTAGDRWAAEADPVQCSSVESTFDFGTESFCVSIFVDDQLRNCAMSVSILGRTSRPRLARTHSTDFPVHMLFKCLCEGFRTIFRGYDIGRNSEMLQFFSGARADRGDFCISEASRVESGTVQVGL